MGKNLKLAIVALLGFSTACSSVKTAPKGEGVEKEPAIEQPVQGRSEQHRIVAMYGVPSPDGERAVPYVAPEKSGEEQNK